MDYPLYGSTLHLYRASPLYHGSSPLFDSLQLHARRLQDHLADDNARRLLLADLQPEIAGSGSLEACEWSLIDDQALRETVRGDPARLDPNNARGVHVQLKFERAKYNALLLGDRSKMSATSGFTSLPLLLLRMPATLRELFLDFLSRTFDSHIFPMSLRSSFLSSSLERLLQQTITREEDDALLDLESLSKGVGVQLSFPAAAPHLKSLDIVIAKDDIREFQSRGDGLWRQFQTSRPRDNDWDVRPERKITGPFTAALSAYLSNHTAMEFDSPAVVISKIALGPFALSAEGKVKVLSTSAAATTFWEALIGEAHGTVFESVGEATTASKPAPSKAHARKQKLKNAPLETPSPHGLVGTTQRLR
ncbi:uncharacterized protein PV09_00873 [Verruconis gallopava]|uniref:Uncharacterized protein n=1 Tax=Verruconis gallopava TaxID=253628 RepID=A0A0D1Z7N3_9PEZI|nr:uncharacterized protein PV09_00873 [Verruconis gallopava]KIW08962.1 hypothetical protein PV09_00873 [Verruconis gallopava]